MNDAGLRRRRTARTGTGDARAAASRPLPGLQFTQVAFAGHNRTEDLGDTIHVSAGLETAFAMLSQAGVSDARLVTGLAPGADLLAAEAWKAAGLGPVHAVYPFLDEEAAAGAAGLMESGTWLDGRATEALGRNPHLAQTRWLIGAADLLVVVWTGEHARGAGGTADAVRLALEHGIPVLWIKPGDPDVLRLIRPEHLDEDFGFLEFLEELRFGREPLVRAAGPTTLHEALADLGLRADPPEDEGEAGPHADRPPRQHRLDGNWRTYALFRRILGGKAPPFARLATPADLAAEPGFVLLTQAHAAADVEASRLGSVHRSHQVILLAVAILAAIAGSASGIWPNTKLLMVSIEIFLALGAFLVWLDSERGRRHHRWGDARRLAEDLRLERVAWALGVSTVPHGANLLSSSAGARHVRRRAGLPSGVFGPDRVATWGAWAVDELIAGQAAYHRAQSTINGRVSHRVHQLENGSFALLMVVLLSYVAATVGMAAFGEHTPHWLSILVAVAGSIVPAIGAACLALEATLALGEQAERSRVLAVRLEAIVDDLGPEPGLEAQQSAAKAAIRLQRAQENHWAEGAVRRRLLRAG
ncbi:MAG: hypothetical protein JWP28_664 [Phenylobacterium sp.]|uniref:hypothetical protein n=1 Tax=Phenylobacterium sp. TaxID=1871053 RepID=UPI0026027493|nr:hypothetical protein [Phenylobacterium sp.]MDB5496633.1 hypothetical protein [Phenylobacterium sp.]